MAALRLVELLLELNEPCAVGLMVVDVPFVDPRSGGIKLIGCGSIGCRDGGWGLLWPKESDRMDGS